MEGGICVQRSLEQGFSEMGVDAGTSMVRSFLGGEVLVAVLVDWQAVKKKRAMIRRGESRVMIRTIVRKDEKGAKEWSKWF